MSLYSYEGQEPTTLPFRVILKSGESRTSLNELSDSELNEIGFIGPITKPVFDEDTHKIEWDGLEYKILELTEEELLTKKEQEKFKRIQNIDYEVFWEKFICTRIYKKLRDSAFNSLQKNILYTEFLLVFGNARCGKENKGEVQNYINILFLSFEFLPEDVLNLQKIMEETHLIIQYDIPDEKYINEHYYDFITNTIVRKKPFESWILSEGKWIPPSPYPKDGKLYFWNEEKKDWVVKE
jgi:hypothetical protein